ncbi:hypothetical protein MRB53_041208 [Persea americana]|nr:hypothetical protein MRB53_041208 [Persea americana]
MVCAGRHDVCAGLTPVHAKKVGDFEIACDTGRLSREPTRLRTLTVEKCSRDGERHIKSAVAEGGPSGWPGAVGGALLQQVRRPAQLMPDGIRANLYAATIIMVCTTKHGRVHHLTLLGIHEEMLVCT